MKAFIFVFIVCSAPAVAAYSILPTARKTDVSKVVETLTPRNNQHDLPWIVSTITTNDRRQFIASLVIAASTSSFLQPALAATTATTTFEDSTHGFALSIPSNWIGSDQTLPDRRTLKLWTAADDANTLLFIAYTPVRDDFTSLASFGSVERVAEQTILPKGELAGGSSSTTDSGELVSAMSKNQAYYFEYTQNSQHFVTLFTLKQRGGTGAAGSVLVTITAQTTQGKWAALQPTLQGIIDSYRAI
jgi:hypothetical protein